MQNWNVTYATVFIDENVNVHKGRAASSLLEQRSALEMEYFDPDCGITRVDLQRWEEAQRYERRTWMEKGRTLLSDRNEDHRKRFADYACLQGANFERGIELGCGPFTNMRLILKHCHVKQIFLLDPLIDQYLEHPYCQYHDARLGGIVQARSIANLRGLFHPLRFFKYLRSAYDVGGVRGIPVRLERAMIETYQANLQFDLVVMINVLDHCQDADRVFEKVLEITKPGSIFVFADTLYDADEIRRLIPVIYDAGHPLRVDRRVVERYLLSNFEPFMQAGYMSKRVFHGVELANYLHYFIGKRSNDLAHKPGN
jgi:SAM-dependent methyltransferase